MSDLDDFEAEQVFRDREGADEIGGESMGPFPAEPAPGSPEAVEQAAETIRKLATREYVEPSYDDVEPEKPADPQAVSAAIERVRSLSPEPERPAHTPGPWSTGRHRLRKQHVVPALGEWWECSVHVGRDNPGNAIAIVYMGGPGATQKDAESVYANAELIARAPLLLTENALLKTALKAETSLKEEYKKQLYQMAEALEDVLKSASPRQDEHPAMWQAWVRGYEALRVAGRL